MGSRREVESEAEAKSKAKAAVQETLDLFKYIMLKTGYQGYDVELMTKVVLLDAGPEGWVHWELKVTEFYANQNGVMHGGAAGVIFDMCTTTALCPVAKPGYWDFQGGVTRALNISYLRAVPINTTIHIHSQVIQHGRTMALIRGTMTSSDSDPARRIVYATCDHHKVNVPVRPDHLALRDEMRMERRKRKQIENQDRVGIERPGPGKARL
ncbi:hypothetical protein ABEF95_008718 [Exophiala dermatitidis]